MAKSRRADMLAVGAYVGLGLLVGAHYWADLQHRISSHLPTDNTWFEWLLAHGAYSVRHLSNPLFSDRQNVPDGVNMMANTSVLGVTIPLAPVTMLLGVPVAYAIWLSGSLAATAATSYWALSRHLVASRGAAFVGGSFLGFAPGIVHHANGQPNFLSHFLLPLVVVAALRLDGARSGLTLGPLVAYQVFINEEMLVVTVLACAVVVVAYAVQRRADARARAPAYLKGLGVAAVVALLITAYPIWYQFYGPQSYRGLLGGAYHRWGEDPAAYVTFARDTLAGTGAAEHTIGRTEQNTWFGWPLVVVAVAIAILLWRRSLGARMAAIVAVVFGVGSLGPKIRFQGRLTTVDGPWAAIPDHLPVIEMITPSRLSFAVVGAVGVLLAVAWDALAAASAAVQLRYAGYAAIVAALVPLVPTPVPTAGVARLPHFIASGQARAYVAGGGTLVPVPIPNNGQGLETLRWSALTVQEFPIPAGYFLGPGRKGEGVVGAPQRPTTALVNRVIRTGVVPPVGPTDRARALDDLRYWRASVVVLASHPREPQLLALMTALLGSPERVDDVWLWRVG